MFQLYIFLRHPPFFVSPMSIILLYCFYFLIFNIVLIFNTMLCVCITLELLFKIIYYDKDMLRTVDQE